MVFLMVVDVSNITAHRVVWCFKRKFSNQVAVHINSQRQRIHIVVNERRTNAVYIFRTQGNIAYRIGKQRCLRFRRVLLTEQWAGYLSRIRCDNFPFAVLVYVIAYRNVREQVAVISLYVRRKLFGGYIFISQSHFVIQFLVSSCKLCIACKYAFFLLKSSIAVVVLVRRNAAIHRIVVCRYGIVFQSKQ